MDTARKTRRMALSQHCGRISLLCFLCFVGLVAALHVVRPEYDPTSRFISEYALGAYGYLMTIAFFALGGGTLFLVVGLSQGPSEGGRSRTGLVLLALFGIGVLVAGTFPTDPKGGPYTLSGELHAVSAIVGLSSLVLSALVWAFRWRKDAQWHAFARPALVLALLMLVSLVGFFASPSHLQGMTERVLVAMDIIWLCFTALKVQAMLPSTRPE